MVELEELGRTIYEGNGAIKERKAGFTAMTHTDQRQSGSHWLLMFFSVPITFSPFPGVLLLTFATSLMLEWPAAILNPVSWNRKSESVSCSVMSDSFVTLMDCSPPGFSVHGILQARILECVAISFSRGSSLLGSNSGFLNCRQILYQLSQSFLFFFISFFFHLFIYFNLEFFLFFIFSHLFLLVGG